MHCICKLNLKSETGVSHLPSGSRFHTGIKVGQVSLVIVIKPGIEVSSQIITGPHCFNEMQN